MNKKLIIVISFFIIAMVYISNNVYATGTTISDAEDFLELGKNEKTTINSTEMEKASNIIYSIAFAIGVVAATIVAATLGIKYMVASSTEKADIKKSMIPFIIGCVVLFGGFAIWKLILTIFVSIEG